MPSSVTDEQRFLRVVSPFNGNFAHFHWPFAKSKTYDAAAEMVDFFERFANLQPSLVDTFHQLQDLVYSEASFEQLQLVVDAFLAKAGSLKLLTISEIAMGQPHDYESWLHDTMLLIYNQSIGSPKKLSQYQPFSSAVYGETSFEMVQYLIRRLELTENDIFLDLGSGVGQVVLHMAVASPCKLCVGIELANWPAHYSEIMEENFKMWMDWYGVSYRPFRLIKGDFLSAENSAYFGEASVIFVNNFSFTASLNARLKDRFYALSDGTRIITTKPLVQVIHKVNRRNVNDLSAISRLEILRCAGSSVSWTSNNLAFYLHTIDKSMITEFFQGLDAGR